MPLVIGLFADYALEEPLKVCLWIDAVEPATLRKRKDEGCIFSSILTSFFRYGRIETTEAKAKELRKFAEQLITLAKRGDLNARRKAIASLADEDIVRKLFDEIAAKYADRQGGYTRILKLGVRRGDAAPMVIIELV